MHMVTALVTDLPTALPRVAISERLRDLGAVVAGTPPTTGPDNLRKQHNIDVSTRLTNAPV